MTTVSLRLSDELMKETDQLAHALHISRAEYIRRAVAAFNVEVVGEEHRQRMMRASARVCGDSMRVNAEFDAIEKDPDA